MLVINFLIKKEYLKFLLINIYILNINIKLILIKKTVYYSYLLILKVILFDFRKKFKLQNNQKNLSFNFVYIKKYYTLNNSLTKLVNDNPYTFMEEFMIE